MSNALAGGFFITEHQRSPLVVDMRVFIMQKKDPKAFSGRDCKWKKVCEVSISIALSTQL